MPHPVASYCLHGGWFLRNILNPKLYLSSVSRQASLLHFLSSISYPDHFTFSLYLKPIPPFPSLSFCLLSRFLHFSLVLLPTTLSNSPELSNITVKVSTKNAKLTVSPSQAPQASPCISRELHVIPGPSWPSPFNGVVSKHSHQPTIHTGLREPLSWLSLELFPTKHLLRRIPLLHLEDPSNPSKLH